MVSGPTKKYCVKMLYPPDMDLVLNLDQYSLSIDRSYTYKKTCLDLSKIDTDGASRMVGISSRWNVATTWIFHVALTRRHDMAISRGHHVAIPCGDHVAIPRRHHVVSTSLPRRHHVTLVTRIPRYANVAFTLCVCWVSGVRRLTAMHADKSGKKYQTSDSAM